MASRGQKEAERKTVKSMVKGFPGLKGKDDRSVASPKEFEDRTK